MGFPGGSVVENLPVNAGDAGSISGSGTSPWRRKWQSTPLFLPGKIPWTEEPSGLHVPALFKLHQSFPTLLEGQTPGLVYRDCDTQALDQGSLVAQLVKNPPAMQETLVQFLVGKIYWRRKRRPTPVCLDFPGGSAGKESTCNVGDLGSIPGLRRSPGEGKGCPLQYSALENSMDCIVHGVSKGWT